MTNDRKISAAAKIPHGTAADTKRYAGTFHLRKLEGVRSPRNHPDFERAEREAARLLGTNPDATFVIVQEVAQVKLKAADIDSAA